MKILIVATPRSGSSELASRLSRYLQLDIYQEPFNFKGNRKPYNFEDNSIVKCIIDQVPEGENRNDPIPFYRQYVTNFDKVILLKRKNLQQQIESWNWFFYRSENNLPVNKVYEYKRQPGYEQDSRYILLCDEWLKRLSSTIKVSYIVYEDLYGLDKQKFRQNVKSKAI